VQSDRRVDADKVIAIQLRHGLILSREKRADPRTKTEVLGLEIDSKKMKLLVSEKKSTKIVKELDEMVRLNDKGRVDTLALAQLLGRLVSVEPAVPKPPAVHAAAVRGSEERPYRRGGADLDPILRTRVGRAVELPLASRDYSSAQLVVCGLAEVRGAQLGGNDWSGAAQAPR